MKLKDITDMDLIVFLVLKGHGINKSKREGNKSIIYFEDNEELQENILKFVNRNENINIADYQATYRRVKTLLCTNKN